MKVCYDGDENYNPFVETLTLDCYFMNVEIYGDTISRYGLDIFLVESATGDIEVLIDDKSFANLTADEIRNGGVDLNGLTYTNHTYKVLYKGDDYQLDKPFEGEFNFTYGFFVIEDFDTIVYIDSNLTYVVSYPTDANGEVVITYNGKKITKKVVADPDDEDYEFNIRLTDFALGENNISFTYVDSNYPEKTIVKTVDANPRISIPYEYRYANEEDVISVLLPSDAKGNLVIYKVGEWNETLDDNNLEELAKIPVVNGKATYNMAGLPLGYSNIRVIYDNEDYAEWFDGENVQVHIIPDVVYDWVVYCNATNNITVTVPDDFNDNLTVKIQSEQDIDGEVIYSQIANGKVSIQLPKLEVGAYNLVISIHGYDSESYYFTVRDTAPEFDMNVTFPSEITSENDMITVKNLPEDANGYLELYINGTLYDIIYSNEDNEFEYQLIFDVIGTHTWEIRYGGDVYYKAAPKSGTFLKDWVEVPEEIYNGDEIDVSLGDKEGYIELKIDGKAYKTEFLDEDGDASIEVDDLTIGTHTYELNYYDKNNVKQLTKSGSFKTVYYFGTNIDDEDSYFFTNEFKLIIDLPEDATGTVTVTVNGKNYTANVVKGTATIILDNLEIGENNVTTAYSGDSKYPADSLKEVIAIEGYGIAVGYSGEDSENFEYVSLLLPEDADGNLTFYRAVWIEGYEDYDDDGDEIWIPGYWEIMYDEQVKTVKLENGTIKVTRADFGYGIYDLFVKYESETDDYPVEQIDIHFDVEPEVKYTEKIVCGENATISVYIENATGSIKIYAYVRYDEEADEPIFELYDTIASDNGKFEKTLTGLPFGEFTFYLEYDGEDMENMFNEHVPHDIEVGVKNVTVPEEFNSDGTGTITFELPEGASGNLTIVDDSTGKVLMENVTYTSANKTIAISGLSTGGHSLELTYVDDKNGEFVFSGEVYVPKPNAGADVTIPETVSGDSFDVVLPKDATGGLLVTIDGNTTYIPLVNGTAKVDLSKLADGTHAVTVKYAGDGNFTGFEKSANVTVKNAVDPVITAKDLSMVYTAGTKYTVTVYGTDGKVAANTPVTFLINGKAFKTVNTDAKGVASVKITQKPGSYKITTKALGVSVVKKLTVKHVLKLKKVKVKRSAKKLVIKATLAKVNGKYLKGKKITLKFKGKKYTAKTNKKGVAKFTIKKKVLKKLKKGKKVTYQATYLKDTVKYTVKVKK